MKRKKQKTDSNHPAQIRWEFDPEIPTHNFFVRRTPGESWDLGDAVGSFIFMVEKGDFLTWEAVMSEEQGLPFNPRQEEALSGLISFNEPADDEILYINEMPRPSEPWYDILNKIAPHLLIEPNRTFDIKDEVECEGWRLINFALREHGEGLSLPPGVESVEQVVPEELRHKLWLQDCYDYLSGLGQDDELTLENPGQYYRIDGLTEGLRKHKDSVAYFKLSLESLLTQVVLPAKDQPIFLEMMQQRLGLDTIQQPLAEKL